jgi:hypothetical protein
MASLAETTARLADQTQKNINETQALYKSNVSLRQSVSGLEGSIDAYATREKRVQFLETVLDNSQAGLADTFAESLKGPLTQLADAIPGKQFLLPFMKLAVQKTPLKGVVERFRDRQRDKIQTEKATEAVNASGVSFSNEEEKNAAIERLKLEMAKKEQEEQIKAKNDKLKDMLGLEVEKFEAIIGKTDEVKEKADKSVKKTSDTNNTKKDKLVEKEEKPSPYIAGSTTDNSAAAVEEARDSERNAERRHNELIQALKSGSGAKEGSAPDTKGVDGPLGGVGGVIKNIGKGFKYLGNNLRAIAKGALAMGLMGASLIPFALAAVKFNDVEWESLAKAGVALVGLAGIGFLLGKASGSMIVGAAAIAILGGALWLAGKGFQQFAELDWKTIGMGLVAIAGLGAIAAVMGLAAPLIIGGAFAIGALGVALIPFAFAAQMAAPAMTEIAEAFNLFKDVPISSMFAIPAALAAVGAALVAMSAGNFVSGILDGIGKLFGNESPIDKIVRLAESAPNVIALGSAMRGFGDDVDAMMNGLDRIDSSKVDKLGELGEKIEDFMDSMPGLIGQAKLAAFALSFASIAASAGVAPAVASGVQAATGEVIEVQQNPKAYVAKRQGQTPPPEKTEAKTEEEMTPVETETGETVVTTQDSTSVPEGKVQVKYKGETVLVDREDAEKVKAIDEEINKISEQRESLREAYDNASPYQRIQKRKIRDADKRLMNKQMQLQKERAGAVKSAVGDTSPTSTLAEDKQSVVDAMAGKGSAKTLEQSQSELQETKNEMGQNQPGGMGAAAIVDNSTTNVSQGGGGGAVMPVPIGEPDQKTKALIANDF